MKLVFKFSVSFFDLILFRWFSSQSRHEKDATFELVRFGSCLVKKLESLVWSDLFLLYFCVFVLDIIWNSRFTKSFRTHHHQCVHVHPSAILSYVFLQNHATHFRFTFDTHYDFYLIGNIFDAQIWNFTFCVNFPLIDFYDYYVTWLFWILMLFRKFVRCV